MAMAMMDSTGSQQGPSMTPQAPPQIRLMTARQFIESLVRNRDSEEELYIATSQLDQILQDDVFEEQYRQEGGVKLVVETVVKSRCRGNGLGGAMGCLEHLLKKDYGWDETAVEVDEIVTRTTMSTNTKVVQSGLSLLETMGAREELFREIYLALLKDSAEPLLHLLEMCATAELLPHVIQFASTTLSRLDKQGWPHLMAVLEQGQIRSHVLGLMATRPDEPAVYLFQDIVVAYANYLTSIQVELEPETSNSGQLTLVRDLEQFVVSMGSNVRDLDWTKVGFENADRSRALEEFNSARTGYLGLECLHYAMNDNRKFYQSLPRDRPTTCPLAKASIAMTDLLCCYYRILPPKARTEFQLGRAGPSRVYQPFLLSFQRLHSFVTRAFVRIWEAMEADNSVRDDPSTALYDRQLTNDFDKVAIVVQELVFTTLDREMGKDLATIERLFAETTYQTIRDRQWTRLKESRWANNLDNPPDDLKRLHEQLEIEAEEFVAEVYIARLLDGDYFVAPPISDPAIAGSRRASVLADAILQWRFWRLDSRRRYLYYEDGVRPEPGKPKPKWQSLSRRVALSEVTHLVVDPHRGQKGKRESPSFLTSALPSGVAHVIHLMKKENPLASLLIPSTPGTDPQDLLTEWSAGLNFLIGSEEKIENETIQAIIQMGLRIRRLTLQGRDEDEMDLEASAPSSVPTYAQIKGIPFVYADVSN